MTGWQVAATELVAIFGLARLAELFASRVRLREEPRASGAAGALLTVAILAGTIVLIGGRPLPPPPPALYLAGGALLAATLLRFWIHVTMGSRWTVFLVDPGRICTTGPYAFVRHPTALASIIELAAVPLAAGAWEIALAGTVAHAWLLSRALPVEEALLCRYRSYRDVMMKRPRLIPGWRAPAGPIPDRRA
jgi:methyltransferase